MSIIRLELNELNLFKNKRRWDLYFIIATENPDDPAEMLITVMPRGNIIPVRKSSGNRIVFKPEGAGTDGLSVLERTIPPDRSVKAQLWLMHSRSSNRKAGDIMSELSRSKHVKTAAEVLLSLGNFSPWITLTMTTIDGVGRFLAKTEDRKMGWVNLDEYFEPEWDMEGRERRNRLSTGFGTVSWSWIVTK